MQIEKLIFFFTKKKNETLIPENARGRNITWGPKYYSVPKSRARNITGTNIFIALESLLAPPRTPCSSLDSCLLKRTFG